MYLCPNYSTELESKDALSPLNSPRHGRIMNVNEKKGVCFVSMVLQDMSRGLRRPQADALTELQSQTNACEDVCCLVGPVQGN